jgi:hypothetical protein
MKRMISVAVVVLLLIMVLSVESFARVAPYRPLGIAPTDDHTWGGDPDGGRSPCGLPGGRYSDLVVTGFAGVDIFVNAGFVEWLFGDWLRKNEHTRYYIIIRNAQRDEGERGVNVNHRGN